MLSIATRPDCLGKDVLSLLEELNRIKPVWVELGLQTIHEGTAAFIRRGYPLPVFDEAMNALAERRIETVIHTILGLPGETPEMMLDTVRYVSRTPAAGIKLQLLHILKNTDLAEFYTQTGFPVLSMEEYVDSGHPLPGGLPSGSGHPPAHRRRPEGSPDRPSVEPGQAPGAERHPPGNEAAKYISGPALYALSHKPAGKENCYGRRLYSLQADHPL